MIIQVNETFHITQSEDNINMTFSHKHDHVWIKHIPIKIKIAFSPKCCYEIYGDFDCLLLFYLVGTFCPSYLFFL